MGTHQMRMEFAYGGGLAKGGTVSLFIDGQKTGEGRVEMTEPFGFSADETCYVGISRFTGVTGLWPARQRLHRQGQLGGH
jgi:arylsulfatase